MRFFIENQELDKEVERVMAQMRLHMNGATTAQMEASGIQYRLNYGVGVPHLKEVASRLPQRFELAERLWFSEIREGMLLAALMVPADKMTEAICKDWSTQINNKDLVERTSMFLWMRVPPIDALLTEWMSGDNPYLKATAYYTFGRLLQADTNSNSVPLSALIETTTGIHDLFIFKALSFALRMKVRHCPDELDEIKTFVQALSASSDRNKQMLAQEVLNELDFMASR